MARYDTALRLGEVAPGGPPFLDLTSEFSVSVQRCLPGVACLVRVTFGCFTRAPSWEFVGNMTRPLGWLHDPVQRVLLHVWEKRGALQLQLRSGAAGSCVGANATLTLRSSAWALEDAESASGARNVSFFLLPGQQCFASVPLTRHAGLAPQQVAARPMLFVDTEQQGARASSAVVLAEVGGQCVQGLASFEVQTVALSLKSADTLLLNVTIWSARSQLYCSDVGAVSLSLQCVDSARVPLLINDSHGGPVSAVVEVAVGCLADLRVVLARQGAVAFERSAHVVVQHAPVSCAARFARNGFISLPVSR